jgi:type IV pilus assembly protein PilB
VQQEDVGLKLLEAKVITPDALQKAQLQMKSGGGSITQALIKVGAVTEDGLSKFLSDLYGVASVDLANYTPDPTVTKLIPGDVANKFQIVPISRSGRRLTVAMANPSNIFAIDDIKFITGFEVQPVVAPEAAIKKAIDKAYDSVASFENVMKGMEDEIEVIEEAADDVPDVTLLGEAEQAPVVKLVNSLITDAVRKGASDIHIEPYEKTLRVRFRIDGTLYE